MQVVADFEVLSRGFDRGLVDDPVALQRVHVTGPHPGPRLGDGQEQVAAGGQVAQHKVPAVGVHVAEHPPRRRTVGSHLYHLFPKLGITTRAQLTDALKAAGPDKLPAAPQAGIARSV